MEIERKIKNHLFTKCSTCEFTIQINSVPANIKSDWEIDTRIDMTKTILLVPVYSLSDATSKGQIVAEVKKFAQTPVVSQLIKQGDVISQDQIQYEIRPIRSFSEVILNSNLIIGMQATKTLQVGQLISYKDVRKEMILKKGQLVKAMIGVNSLEVSINAMAEENGSVGDVIKVRNMDSSKYFSARIIDKGLVQID